jgi:hypothetical protein
MNAYLESVTASLLYDEKTALNLFELLIPNELKRNPAEQADNLVLVRMNAPRSISGSISRNAAKDVELLARWEFSGSLFRYSRSLLGAGRGG